MSAVTPESVVKSWKISFQFCAHGPAVHVPGGASSHQYFRFSLPTQVEPVPALEVSARVTVYPTAEPSVSLEGSEFEYGGKAFSVAAQSLLSAALEDKARRMGLRS
jgi:hypothetical protein